MENLKRNGLIVLSESEISKLSKKINWEKSGMNGLIPVIAQDIKTGEVLMQAYINQEAFENTLKTGNATYRSRSRNELWEKGLTSGATQKVYDIKIDCDADSVIYFIEQLGEVGACHIDGQNSCFDTFYFPLREDVKGNIGVILNELFSTLEKRKQDYEKGIIGPSTSYTVKLLDKGLEAILKKVNEESMEVIKGARKNDRENVVYEISDLLYFLNVLMVYSGIQPYEIANELSRRFGVSGIEEKKNRSASKN